MDLNLRHFQSTQIALMIIILVLYLQHGIEFYVHYRNETETTRTLCGHQNILVEQNKAWGMYCF